MTKREGRVLAAGWFLGVAAQSAVLAVLYGLVTRDSGAATMHLAPCVVAGFMLPCLWYMLRDTGKEDNANG